MGMDIDLTPQLEELVRQKVASGLYTSASDVVGAALLLMEEDEQLKAAKFGQLKKDIVDGLES